MGYMRWLGCIEEPPVTGIEESDSELRELIYGMLACNSDQRLSCTQGLSHTYVGNCGELAPLPETLPTLLTRSVPLKGPWGASPPQSGKMQKCHMLPTLLQSEAQECTIDATISLADVFLQMIVFSRLDACCDSPPA